MGQRLLRFGDLRTRTHIADLEPSGSRPQALNPENHQTPALRRLQPRLRTLNPKPFRPRPKHETPLTPLLMELTRYRRFGEVVLVCAGLLVALSFHGGLRSSLGTLLGRNMAFDQRGWVEKLEPSTLRP